MDGAVLGLSAGPALLRVVAAALVREGRVLAARRRRPLELAGGWEFPGGKIEAGESAAAAVERECREELGVTVRALAELATAGQAPISLELWHVELLAGEPVLGRDHDALRWVREADLARLDWLPIDRRLLGAVGTLLR